MRILNMSWFKLQKVSFAFIKFIEFCGCWFSWSRSMAMPCGRLFSITLVYTTLIFIVFCSYSGQNVQKERNQIWYAFLDWHISIWQAEVIWSLSKPHTHTQKICMSWTLLISQADGEATEGMGLPISSKWLS